MSFFDALQFDFMRSALATGLLASLACGVVGTYVVTRRISYIAASISHCVFGGLSAARYCQVVYGWSWFDPLWGAAASALLAAVIIGLVSLRAKEREDTVIGAIWAIGMALGVLLISKTPTYNQDMMSYLFGNILLVSSGDLWLIAGLDVLVVAAGLAFYNKFLAVCFDEEFARLRGVHVEFYYLLLLCVTALTVVVLVKVVGIILVIALLTLPAAIAGQFSRSLLQMMAGATVLCVVLTTGGLALSYEPGLPAGATTIVLAGAVYLITLIVSPLILKRRASRARVEPGPSPTL